MASSTVTSTCCCGRQNLSTSQLDVFSGGTTSRWLLLHKSPPGLAGGSNSASAQPIRAQLPPRDGRGLSARKASAAGQQKRMKGREDSLEGWVQVAVKDELAQGKNKAIIRDNRGYVLVRRDEALFCVEANCTACKFPVIEGKVTDEQEAVGIDCPLCHTRFSLVDGQVLKYCPKDGPLQWFVGILKENAPKQNAKVFPARLSNSGRIYVKFI